MVCLISAHFLNLGLYKAFSNLSLLMFPRRKIRIDDVVYNTAFYFFILQNWIAVLESSKNPDCIIEIMVYLFVIFVVRLWADYFESIIINKEPDRSLQ
jgi:hypothetical protein